jgi:hypothetical protein
MSFILDRAISATSVTPSDTENISGSSRGVVIFCVDTGNVTVETLSGEEVTFTSVPAYTELPIRVVKVLSTGTTASDLLALK